MWVRLWWTTLLAAAAKKAQRQRGHGVCSAALPLCSLVDSMAESLVGESLQFRALSIADFHLNFGLV